MFPPQYILGAVLEHIFIFLVVSMVSTDDLEEGERFFTRLAQYEDLKPYSFVSKRAMSGMIVSVRERVCQQLMINDISKRYNVVQWFLDPDFQVSSGNSCCRGYASRRCLLPGLSITGELVCRCFGSCPTRGCLDLFGT